MSYIKLFFEDGDTQVSEAPTTTNAVLFTLDAAENEVGTPIQLYALADDGYVIDDVVITPTGTTATKWALAPDDEGEAGEFGAYGDPLDLGDDVGDTTHVPFWIKAKAIDSETPVNDTTVTLVVTGVASAE